MALWSMRTPDQVKRDFVDQWLAKANQDLFSASILLKGEPVSLEAAAFVSARDYAHVSLGSSKITDH